VIRRRIAIIKFKPRLLEYRAATKIQRGWRVFMRKRDFMENYCATIIQSMVRYHQAVQLKHKMIAARTIQTWYRCQATRRGYLYYISARKIQTMWRGYDARKLADEERWVREYAATTIQKTWRMFYQYSSFIIYKHEKKAATDIQRHWRGFWKYSHFIIMRYEACKIQALFRGVQQRKILAQQREAATVIQTAARSLIAKKSCHMERLFSAMIYAAQQGLSQRIAARTIQRGFREHNLRVKQKQAALVIERFFIWVRAEVEREIERRERQRIKKRRSHSKSKTRHQNMIYSRMPTISLAKEKE
jgi:Myosin heavy chain